MTGHTGIAIDGKRGFHGDLVQGRKERLLCWELEESRLQSLVCRVSFAVVCSWAEKISLVCPGEMEKGRGCMPRMVNMV